MPAVDPPWEFQHVTVMVREVVQAIAPRPGGLYLDLTAGGGGHSEALLAACDGCRVIALDRDMLAVEAARLMESHKINAVIVVDAEQRVVGALNIHDLLRARVV